MSAPAEERIAASGLRFDFDRIRADVEALAAMERGSAAAEKPQVAWIEERLREAGAHQAHTESFRFQRRWIWRHGAHAVAGIGAAAAGGPAGAVLAAATLASFELEAGGRSSWTAQLFPRGDGSNVVARIPAAGPAERTVVFVAHHDAARTGLLWRLPRTTKPLALSAEVALALVAIGCALGSRVLRAVAGACLAVLTVLGLDVARSRVVPGANDNATGVTALVGLTAALARDPLERTDVIALFSDCEEVGLGGAAAWFDAHGDELDKARTLVVSLDTLGSGEPAVIRRDGALSAVYPAESRDWADRGALRAAVSPPRRTDNTAPTDAIVAQHAGFRSLSLVSAAPDGTLGPHYHQPSDTPDNVDWTSVEQCMRLAGGIARVWDSAG